MGGSGTGWVNRYNKKPQRCGISRDHFIISNWWVNQQCLATIGITEYAAKALGDVVFVELPTVDSDVSAGDTIGAVESVKSASDIMTPVTGTIVEANMALEEKPKTINDSPEGDGWIARVKVTDASELDGLMDAKEYQASLEEEE